MITESFTISLPHGEQVELTLISYRAPSVGLDLRLPLGDVALQIPVALGVSVPGVGSAPA